MEEEEEEEGRGREKEEWKRERRNKLLQHVEDRRKSKERDFHKTEKKRFEQQRVGFVRVKTI